MLLGIDTSNRKEQRKFGFVMAGACAVIGGVRSWLVGGFAPTFFYIAAAFILTGVVYPRALKPVYDGWLRFALVVNWVMTRVLLTIAFYGMITPARLVLLLRRQDPLRRKWEPDSPTYWQDAEPQPDSLDRYRQQF